MIDDEARRTVRVWEADLGEDGRKLTLDELVGLEQMHQCQQLAALVEAVRLQSRLLASLEGRFDRLERFLGMADARYPREDGRRPLPVQLAPSDVGSAEPYVRAPQERQRVEGEPTR